MRLRWCLLLVAGLVCGSAPAASAGQLGALVSPGPLAKAHAALEGVRNCVSCHEAGQRVTVSKCLACHAPIADRVARKTGVHRSAGTDCVACHVEHAGRDAELRQFDMRTFNHGAEAGYPLDGLHAPIARNCAACHKQRSFLTAQPACATCHNDVHKGALGPNCTSCHTTSIAFKTSATAFDHKRSRFPLTGKHQEVMCVECHKTGQEFRGVAFESCTSCHMSPHRTTLAATCTACHTTDNWTTRTVMHDDTRFPLLGAHIKVACEKCHVSGDMAKAIPFAQCSVCHVNVHKDSIKDDCRTCHTETSFHVSGPSGASAKFDHTARTGYTLEGKHAAVECRKCHTNVSADTVPLARKSVDYGGASTKCVSCHTDEHKGEFGLLCQSCHRPATWDVKGFSHPRNPEFFTGQHTDVQCVKCHVPPDQMKPTRVGAAVVSFSPTAPSMECRTCHSDVHFGQFTATCETCHTVGGVKFAAVSFSHANTTFPLTGKHAAPLECVKCHKSETGRFPSGSGTATRFAPVASACRTCHEDPHLGQTSSDCETCHATTTFTIANYTHQGMEDFFGGFHGRLACEACHKKEAGVFPAGSGNTMRYRVGRTCADCHKGF